MSRRVGMIRAACLSATWAVCLAATCAVAEPSSVTLVRNISYGPLPQQTLTTCRPAGAGRPLPGVVLIHGGGWVAMDKDQLIPLCESLAREGLFAATIDYRLVEKTDATTRWPAQLADAQLAVRWLRANAKSVGLDPAKLCAYGESAGGHLAVFLAAQKTIEPSDMAARLVDQPVSVVCAVDNFGPVDLVHPGPLKNLAQILIGKSFRSRNLAAFRAASPLYLVDAQTAPILIEQGSGDRLVEPIQSFALFGALIKAHVPARFAVFPGGHAWQNVPEIERAVLAKAERQFLHAFLDEAVGR